MVLVPAATWPITTAVAALAIPIMVATGNVYIVLIPMIILFVGSLVVGHLYFRGVRSGRWRDPSVEAAKTQQG